MSRGTLTSNDLDFLGFPKLENLESFISSTDDETQIFLKTLFSTCTTKRSKTRLLNALKDVIDEVSEREKKTKERLQDDGSSTESIYYGCGPGCTLCFYTY